MSILPSALKGDIAVDKDTGCEFDDYVEQEYDDVDTTHWTQVCGRCAMEQHLNWGRLAIGEGNGICGVVGCNSESDHYYDFIAEEV